MAVGMAAGSDGAIVNGGQHSCLREPDPGSVAWWEKGKPVPFMFLSLAFDIIKEIEAMVKSLYALWKFNADEFPESYSLEMYLVSLAQSGHLITHDLLSSNVDLKNLKPPTMEGLDVLLGKEKKA